VCTVSLATSADPKAEIQKNVSRFSDPSSVEMLWKADLARPGGEKAKFPVERSVSRFVFVKLYFFWDMHVLYSVYCTGNHSYIS
jgi:hypothetical protein